MMFFRLISHHRHLFLRRSLRCSDVYVLIALCRLSSLSFCAVRSFLFILLVDAMFLTFGLSWNHDMFSNFIFPVMLVVLTQCHCIKSGMAWIYMLPLFVTWCMIWCIANRICFLFKHRHSSNRSTPSITSACPTRLPVKRMGNPRSRLTLDRPQPPVMWSLMRWPFTPEPYRNTKALF